MEIEEVRRAVRRAASLVPGEMRCLALALAARWMLFLRDVPSELTIGVKGPAFEAHAWLTANGMPVSGVGQSEGFRVISTMN